MYSDSDPTGIRGRALALGHPHAQTPDAREAIPVGSTPPEEATPVDAAPPQDPDPVASSQDAISTRREWHLVLPLDPTIAALAAIIPVADAVGGLPPEAFAAYLSRAATIEPPGPAITLDAAMQAEIIAELRRLVPQEVAAASARATARTEVDEIDTAAAAALCHVAEATIRRWVRSGRLVPLRGGGAAPYWFARAAVVAARDGGQRDADHVVDLDLKQAITGDRRLAHGRHHARAQASVRALGLVA